MNAITRVTPCFFLVVSLAAGCGGGAESAAAVDASTDQTSASSESPSTDASAAGKSTESGGCPPLGDLTESADVSATPLVFDFRHPSGFEVRKSERMGTHYAFELAKSMPIDNRTGHVAISIMQSLEPVDVEIPRMVKAALDNADNPAFAAMAEMLPKPAGELSFGSSSVPLFRTETEDKVVYNFNLPGDGGFYEVNVHFVPSHGATACSDRLDVLGEQWVQALTPSST